MGRKQHNCQQRLEFRAALFCRKTTRTQARKILSTSQSTMCQMSSVILTNFSWLVYRFCYLSSFASTVCLGSNCGAKSLFLMSGGGVKCYVPDPAGELSPLTTLKLDLTTLNARRRPRPHRWCDSSSLYCGRFTFGAICRLAFPLLGVFVFESVDFHTRKPTTELQFDDGVTNNFISPFDKVYICDFVASLHSL